MSNRNFDSRVVIQRLQQQTIARNMYLNMYNGSTIISNPQNSFGNAAIINNYRTGSETMYFRGLVGG